MGIGCRAVSAFPRSITTKSVGELTLSCPEAGNWKFDMTLEEKDSCEIVHISMDATVPSVPVRFELSFECPQKDAHHLWASRSAIDRCRLKSEWMAWYGSALAQSMPLYTFMNTNNKNSLTVACSESMRMVDAVMGLREEGAALSGVLGFFSQAEAQLSNYEVSIMFDRRERFWADVVNDASQWIADAAGFENCEVPDAAFAPLYSTWYQFHQNVSDKEIEAECRLASAMGMKTIILDDGWQTDDNNKGYSFCGDWEVSRNRFPDMAGHVRKVHEMGMRYMIWYSVPYVGEKSRAYEKFQGKYLAKGGQDWWVLDPRFPEVRDYLCEVYEKALKEWNIDGFKLDFIDEFYLRGTDPAITENYEGRDIKSLPQAVDVLMKEIRSRLQAIKPDILIEFRQEYTGPAIRQYGNMMRAADCPGDMQGNRMRTTTLRLTSGKAAVHSDMLEWNVAETPENAARAILSVLYTTIQYSVMLRDLPESHTKVIRHWLDFSQKHRTTLLHGKFRPYHPEVCYPILEAESTDERIITAYQDGLVVKAGAPDKDIYIINASGEEGLVIDLQKKPRRCSAYNVFGEPVSIPVPRTGLSRVSVPKSGYVIIEY